MAIFGGIMGYNAVRKVDETMVKRLLILGLAVTIAIALFRVYVYFRSIPFK